MESSGGRENPKRTGGGRGRGRGRGRGNRGGDDTGRGRGRNEGRGGGRGGGRGRDGGHAGRGRSAGENPYAAAELTPKATNGTKGAESHTVQESDRIRLTRILMEFRENDEKRLEFPPNLTNTERKFVHELAAQLGLISKSTGKGENRKINVTKRDEQKKKNFEHVPILDVGKKGAHAMLQHIQRFPPSHSERLESHETGAGLIEALSNAKEDTDFVNALQMLGLDDAKKATVGEKRGRRVDLERRKRSHAEAQKLKSNNEEYKKMLEVRSKLPAAQHEKAIVSTVQQNPVTIISGETGCGKCELKIVDWSDKRMPQVSLNCPF
jgi:hypothetical protein